MNPKIATILLVVCIVLFISLTIFNLINLGKISDQINNENTNISTEYTTIG